MFNSILEQLFHGRINPFERKIPFTPERTETEQKIQRAKEYFRRELSTENYKRLDELETLYTESSDFENIYYFKHGFTLGALIMVEVFLEQEGAVNE